MQRVKRSTAADVMPAAPVGGTPGFFAKPDPAGVPATVPGYEWYNGIQEELMAVIEGQGLTGSDADHTLLRQAITKMIQAGQKAVIINNAAFAPAVIGTGKAVYWDAGNNRFDLAVADGSAKQNMVGFADVPNAKVYAFGDAVLFAGLAPGSRYYLDGATAGAITSAAPSSNSVFVGIAKSATEVFVDIDVQIAQNGLPAGYINGLTLANNDANPTTQIYFSAGRARDAGNAVDMVLAATMTKTLQAAGAWAAGSGNNGLFAGVKANSTWYHCFLIRKAADGSIDCGFDTSITAVNIPAGYTAYRRLGSIKTDTSGNIMQFTQMRDEFWWNAAILDISSTTIGAAAQNYAISVPPGVAVVADLMLYGGGNATQDSNLLVRSPFGNDVAPPAAASIPNSSPATIANIAGSNETGSGTHARILTNTSSQLTVRAASANSQLYAWTRGWRDQL